MQYTDEKSVQKLVKLHIVSARNVVECTKNTALRNLRNLSCFFYYKYSAKFRECKYKCIATLHALFFTFFTTFLHS